MVERVERVERGGKRVERRVGQREREGEGRSGNTKADVVTRR
jgi:hypothetical protein